jgi:hypothetical protein
VSSSTFHGLKEAEGEREGEREGESSHVDETVFREKICNERSPPFFEHAALA